jgi:hypothetical protein
VRLTPFDHWRWHRWFAWRPVSVFGKRVWLETVERRWAGHATLAGWEYRDLNAGLRTLEANNGEG